MNVYNYVGPDDIRDKALKVQTATIILDRQILLDWIRRHLSHAEFDGSVIAAFVIDQETNLRLADRRSEHVACSEGRGVLSAGEMTFAEDGEVVDATNQSTGFCPEPESWPLVQNALDSIGVDHPGCFSRPVIFRKCPKCLQRNIVKDNWFFCDLCETDLPIDWNFQ